MPMISNSKIKVSPSVIAGDLTSMGAIVADFDSSVIDLLHMDVMDGHFVPNITFGPAYIKDIAKHTDIPLDVHLMIEKPENSLEEYLKLDPWCTVIHYESTRFPMRCLDVIRKSGSRPGITINPATPVEAVYDVLPYCDMILVMSVDPGFAGQSFMPTALGRIERIRDFAVKNGMNDLMIQVDGGVNNENIKDVVSAGAEIIVAGSSAFKGGDVNKNVINLKNAAAE